MPALTAMGSSCLCLWRGFEQITRTAPWRRMILHFSHMGLTEGRTFMFPSRKKRAIRRRAQPEMGARARPARLAKVRSQPFRCARRANSARKAQDQVGRLGRDVELRAVPHTAEDHPVGLRERGLVSRRS